MATTWNPADKYADIVLSNGDLTASTSATFAYQLVRGTTAKSSGKWYIEFAYAAGTYAAGNITFGIAQSGHVLDRFVGAESTGWGWDDYDNGFKSNGGSLDDINWGIPGYAGAIIMLAVDFDAGNIWWGIDGTWFESGNPATATNPAFTNVTGPAYPAASVGVPADNVTPRFDAGSQTYAAPSGFNAWDSSQFNTLPAETLTWAANALSQRVFHSLPVATLAWTAQRPQQVYDAPSFAIARAVYRCYLTGDAETPPVDDLELPLASFQSRRRNGTQTYLAITVPNPVPYIDGINARLNGDIVIYSGFAVGDVENLTELLRVNFGSFRYDLGARSGTASLSGHKQVTYSNPKTRALSGISYKSVTDGFTLVRCEPDMWLNPGDTADIGDATFVVDTITYTIKPTLATMEVTEVSE